MKPQGSSARDGLIKGKSENTIDSVFDAVCEDLRKTTNGTEKDLFDLVSWNIEFLSTELTFDYPDLFVPYYFYSNYNVLTIIADAFDISLPDIPKKADYTGRIKYYIELCKVLTEFGRQNELSLYEL